MSKVTVLVVIDLDLNSENGLLFAVLLIWVCSFRSLVHAAAVEP